MMQETEHKQEQPQAEVIPQPEPVSVARPRPQLTPEQQASRQAAMRIADALGEKEHGPRAQVGRVVQVLGIERAQALHQQTIDVEAAGGMMLPDGSRRRTPGGVFFKLARDSTSEAEREKIFPLRPWTKKRAQRSTSQAAPRLTPVPTSPAVITEIPNATGEARTVKITLVGRPGRIIAKQGYIMTTMQSSKVPSLPKGLPVPPTTPTTYTVYISQKQWQKIAEALANPEDVLIAEGTPVYDAELEGIAVYVTNVSTKQMQQAQRAAQAGT